MGCMKFRISTRPRSALLAAGALSLAVLGAAAPAHAAVDDVMNQLGATIGGVEDYANTGWSVAMSGTGTTIAVSTPWRSLGYQVNGEVQVLDWDGSAWVQRGASILGAGEGLLTGWAVDLDGPGNVVAIGTPGHNSSTGQVEIYTWNGSNWVQKGSVLVGQATGDEFGRQVNLAPDGLTLAVSAPYHDANANNDGTVYVYSWSGSDWVLKGSVINGEAAEDLSGWSLSLSSDGNVVAIGASGNDDAGSGAGHVRVYEWDSTAWVQRGPDLDGETAGDSFGESVSLDGYGNVLAVGAIGNNTGFSDGGAAYVYSWNGSAWVQYGTTISEEVPGANAGDAVAISSSTDTSATLVVASPNYSGSSGNVGRVRIFDWNGTNWVQRTQFLLGSDSGGAFGSAVGANAGISMLIVGAPYSDVPGPDRGTAQVYQLQQDPPTLPPTGANTPLLVLVALAFIGTGVAIRRLRHS